MNNVKILDCTLRDGGYINNFNFGKNTISRIIQKLSNAAIDVIECGFMKEGVFDENKSVFGSIEDIKRIISDKNRKLMYVAMIQYGAIPIQKIEAYDGDSIDGIRLTFHEHEIDGAFEDGKNLIEKGYKLFVQPVGTIGYSDKKLIDLIERVNRLKPYAFYIVDTFGTMYKKDLLRLFYLIDNNLDSRISIGFHSHNNLQLSFSNAQELIQLNSFRQIFIDTSIYGIGRGAGNLCTELLTRYINDNISLRYNNLEILEILDSFIKPLRKQYEWGYNSAYYIASVNGCHPNYAQNLLNRQTLRVQDINAILSGMDKEERLLYNHTYIENEYLKYMSSHIDDMSVIYKYTKMIKGKKILILAPGKSLTKNQKIINDLSEKQDLFIVSVNFIPYFIKRLDCIFISNMKRYENIFDFIIKIPEQTNAVVTSNIQIDKNEKIDRIDYATYLNEESCIIDNAGLMCINFLRTVGVKNIMLAGFDGFSDKMQDNYFESSMFMDVEAERLQKMNQAFSRKLIQLKTQMEISFFTPTIYEGKNE